MRHRRSRTVPILLVLAVLVVLGRSAEAQAPGAGDEGRRPPVRVFIDAPNIPPAVIEKGLTFLTHVRSSAEAQVHVTMTSGGESATLNIRGLAEFAGVNDTLTVARPAGQDPAEAEREIIHTLQLALLRFATKTSVTARLNVDFLDAVKPTAVADPWRFWVFNLGLNAFLDGEQTYRSSMLSASLSAQKVTPEWKVRFGASLGSSRDTYDLDDYHYTSATESRNLSGLVVRSIDDHWSAGMILQAGSSTYDNTAFRLVPQAAVEYDLFPYSQSTRKQLRFLYGLGLSSIRYREETIYDRIRETLWGHSLSATLDLKQPWGTISTTLVGSQYFHDLSKNRLTLSGSISLRIFEGFNFHVDGGGSRVRDQLFLPKGGASLEEVLLRRRQLETGYNYYFSVGLSYTFGSIRSNVVNPRFGSGNGGMSIRISM
jgi:hypothetical protein